MARVQTSRSSWNPTGFQPWWAAFTVWIVVNAVNVLQANGFLSRVRTGDYAVNHVLGYGIVALVVPALVALFGFVRSRSGWRFWSGPAVFGLFVAMSLAVDHIWPVEFRNPQRYDVLVPYLVLFFGSIFLMGVPMFRLNKKLWLVTVTTTVLLLASMLVAMQHGVG